MKSLPHESTLVESLIADTPTTLAEIRAQLQVYRDVFESAPFGCGLTNQDGIIQEANHALAQMLGRAPDALLAQPLREFVAADEIEREQFTLHLERLRAGHANEAWAMRFQSVTGEPFDAAVNVSCLANGRSTDGTMLLRWVVRDITRPKRTEGMLSQSEQKLRGIFDNSADGISLVDEQGVIVEWNASMERITGVTRAQVLGKTYRMIVPQLIANPLLARDLAARIHTRLMDASPWTGSTTELDLQRPDQKRCVVQLSVFPIITANGLMLGSIMRDITERKQMEDALRAANDELEARVSERTRALTQAIHELQNEVARRQGIEDSLRHRLRIEKIILNSVPVILYTLRRGEAQSNITWMSPNAEQITGFPPHRFNADPMFWLSRIHPADRAQVMERIHTLDHCALTPTEYRWQCADGGYRWFLDRIEGGTQDAPTEYVGTWLDITERKRAEEEEHTQRLLAEVLRDTAESFNNTLDADQVFKCLLTNVERLVPCDGVNVMLAAEGLPRLFAWHGYEKFAPPNLGADLDAIDSWRTFLRMAETGQPLLIPDTAQDELWDPGLASAWVRSYIGMPIRVQGKTVGFLNMDSATPGFFNPTHVARVKAITDQASVALANAQLFAEARQKAERLRMLSRRLVEAQEIERARIARELHDEIGQTLTALMVNLHYIERHFQEPTLIRERTTDAKHLTNNALAGLHQLVTDLRPLSLEHQGLVSALRQYIESFCRQFEVPVEFDEIGLGEARLPDEMEIALYRIAQEALTNVARHARAQSAQVLLTQRAGSLSVLIWDNGIGFEPGAASLKNRMGLVGMRERAEMLGGRFTVESQIGTGTTVRVEVPNVRANSDR